MIGRQNVCSSSKQTRDLLIPAQKDSGVLEGETHCRPAYRQRPPSKLYADNLTRAIEVKGCYIVYNNIVMA